MDLKKICMALFAGFLFMGGSMMYSIGTYGLAHAYVDASRMLPSLRIGICFMIVGVILGVISIFKKDGRNNQIQKD